MAHAGPRATIVRPPDDAPRRRLGVERCGARAEEEREQRVAIGASVHDRRCTQQQHPRSGAGRGKRGIAPGGGRPRVMCFVHDHQGGSDGRVASAHRLQRREADTHAGPARRALPLGTERRGRDHMRRVEAGRDRECNDRLSRARRIRQQRAAELGERRAHERYGALLFRTKRERAHPAVPDPFAACAPDQREPREHLGAHRAASRYRSCHLRSGAMSACRRPYACSTAAVSSEGAGGSPSAAARAIGARRARASSQ